MKSEKSVKLPLAGVIFFCDAREKVTFFSTFVCEVAALLARVPVSVTDDRNRCCSSTSPYRSTYTRLLHYMYTFYPRWARRRCFLDVFLPATQSSFYEIGADSSRRSRFFARQIEHILCRSWYWLWVAGALRTPYHIITRLQRLL